MLTGGGGSQELGYPVQWCDLTYTLNNASGEAQATLLRSLEAPRC